MPLRAVPSEFEYSSSDSGLAIKSRRALRSMGHHVSCVTIGGALDSFLITLFLALLLPIVWAAVLSFSLAITFLISVAESSVLTRSSASFQACSTCRSVNKTLRSRFRMPRPEPRPKPRMPRFSRQSFL